MIKGSLPVEIKRRRRRTFLGHGRDQEPSLQEILASIRRIIAEDLEGPTLSVKSVIIPEKKVSEGILINSTTSLWLEIVRALGQDWRQAYSIESRQWEEILAGAFHKMGYQVTLTPRSGDYGRDLIAVSKGIGCVKILGSMKAYAPGHLVTRADVSDLVGVMAGELDASKGIVATTSDFAPRILQAPQIKRLVPTRLELINGERLREWLAKLAEPQE
jgi:restriction system protein